MSDPVYYMSEVTHCGACGSELLGIMYDARTHNGQWDNLCAPCFRSETSGKLGPELGQKYKRVMVPPTDAQKKNNAVAMPQERWLKIQ